jgi:molybdopterin/thiamine biosynthesis adenylyltransferase
VSGRFDRQSFIGRGQKEIAKARLGLIGYGGGGSHVGQQVAHIGFKNVLVCDPDIVEDSNLNRLVGATAEDVARATPKASVASRVMRAILPRAHFLAKRSEWERLTADLRCVDVLVGCVDSFAQRASLERYCRRFLIPYLDIGMDVARSGDAYRIYGQVALSMPGGPCLRCMGIIDDEMLAHEERARQYGDAGSKPQVIWPNGVLASTAVGLLVQLFAPWSGRSVASEYLEYDGNTATIRRAPRMDAILAHELECEHFDLADVGDPLFGLGM